MKTIVFKLFHDFRLNKTKFLLCVIAAGLSSWGISSAFYSYSLANRDFTENFAATHPSDLAITITHATDSVVQAILSLPEVEGIERREALVGRIRAYNSWMPVTLFAVENFDRLKYNSFRLVETNSPSFGGIYIEQNAAIFLDGSDEKAIIRFAGSDSIVLKKSGTIHDPGLAPAQMERVVYAYTDLKTAATLIKSGTRRLLIKTNFKKPTQRDLNEFGEKLSAQIKQAGGEVITTTVPLGENIRTKEL